MTTTTDQTVQPATREVTDGEDTVTVFAPMQDLIDVGTAWKMEGSVGREAMTMIEAGHVVLGEIARTNYWGFTVPSRYDVEPGTKGSVAYALAQQSTDEYR